MPRFHGQTSDLWSETLISWFRGLEAGLARAALVGVVVFFGPVWAYSHPFTPPAAPSFTWFVVFLLFEVLFCWIPQPDHTPIRGIS